MFTKTALDTDPFFSVQVFGECVPQVEYSPGPPRSGVVAVMVELGRPVRVVEILQMGYEARLQVETLNHVWVYALLKISRKKKKTQQLASMIYWNGGSLQQQRFTYISNISHFVFQQFIKKSGNPSSKAWLSMP